MFQETVVAAMKTFFLVVECCLASSTAELRALSASLASFRSTLLKHGFRTNR